MKNEWLNLLFLSFLYLCSFAAVGGLVITAFKVLGVAQIEPWRLVTAFFLFGFANRFLSCVLKDTWGCDD